MPQPKSGATNRKRTTTRSKPAAAKSAAKPAAAKAGARTPAAKSTARKPAAAGTGARKPAAAKSTTRKPAAAATGAAGDEQLRQNLAQLRDTLAQAVVIPAERVQAVIDEARQGGHIAPRAAQDLAGSLLTAGRKQADELRAQVEALVGRGRGQTDDLVSKVTKGAREATRRATQAGDPVLRQVDRVRRRTAPTSFPITAYDELKVPQIKERLADLTRPQLRKVRTYEAKGANRKSVLGAIDKALG